MQNLIIRQTGSTNWSSTSDMSQTHAANTRTSGSSNTNQVNTTTNVSNAYLLNQYMHSDRNTQNALLAKYGYSRAEVDGGLRKAGMLTNLYTTVSSDTQYSSSSDSNSSSSSSAGDIKKRRQRRSARIFSVLDISRARSCST